MIRRRILAAAGVVAALVAGGRTPASPFDDLEPSEPAATLLCETSIGDDAFPAAEEGYVIVADAVGVMPSLWEPRPDGGKVPVPHQNVHHGGEGALPYFTKTGIFIKQGTAVTIRTTAPADSAGIVWGTNGGPPVTVLEAPACDGDPWNVYPGGIATDGPRCVELLVTAGGETESVWVAAGAPCPGDVAVGATPGPPQWLTSQGPG